MMKIFIPDSIWAQLIVALGMGYLIYKTLSYWKKVKFFHPGYQYTLAAKPLLRGNKNQKQVKEVMVTEEKLQKQLYTKRRFELMAKRMGDKSDYEEEQIRKARETSIAPIYILIATGLVGMIGIAVDNVDLILVGVLLGFIFALYRIMETDIKYTMYRPKWKDDATQDLGQLVSLFIYSDSSGGVYDVIVDFIPTSNALKTDLLSFKNNSEGMPVEDALDILARDVDLPEMTSFVDYIKTVEGMKPAEVAITMANLQGTLDEKVDEINKKKMNKTFKLSINLIIVAFTGAMGVFMASTIAEIISAMGDTF